MGASANIFCQRSGKNFYNQPYSGCFILVNQMQDLLLKPVNFFQDGSKQNQTAIPGWIAMEKTNKILVFFKRPV